MAALLAIAAVAAALVGSGQYAERTAADFDRARPVTKLTLKSSPYGRVLFSGGYAVYVFTRDKGRGSNCNGACAEAWPPLEAKGRLVAGDGVRKGLIATTTRDDGTTQVTYRGRPVYHYVDDPRGRVLCHDVIEFGGTWYAVRASGKPAP